jgi:CubicO group peptidase (beta-lactamase class C family)
LLAELLPKHGLELNSFVSPVLEGTSQQLSALLAGTTFKHLLEHTHGLDGSRLTATPVSSSGLINLNELSHRFEGSARLGRPGELSSYDNGGAMIAAAVVEHLSGQTFGQHLRETLLRNGIVVGTSANTGAAIDICPASGAGLAFKARDLLAFAQLAMNKMFAVDGQGASPKITAHAGWQPTEDGIYLGWKSYVAGWFGHNSVEATAPSLIRVNPARRAAIVVATSGYNPNGILGKVFQLEYPELRRFSTPKLLGNEAIGALDLAQFQGRFSNARSIVSVFKDTASRLALSVERIDAVTGELQQTLTSALRPAHNDIFLVETVSPSFYSFIQFLKNGSGRCQWLWNGQSVWRRV